MCNLSFQMCTNVLCSVKLDILKLLLLSVNSVSCKQFCLAHHISLCVLLFMYYLTLPSVSSRYYMQYP